MEVFEALQQPIQQISGVFAILVNSLLMYLVIYCSPKSLGAYKYLMMYITIFEVLYALLDLLVSPDLYTSGSALVAVLDSSKSGTPIGRLHFLNIVFCGSFGMSMAIFAVHFVFRYLVIKGNKRLTSAKPTTMLVWFLIPIGYGMIWSTICMSTMFPTPETDRFLNETYIKIYGGRVEDLTYFGPYFYPNGKIDWKPCIGIGACTFIMSISSLTMLLCGIKSYNRINNLIHQSGQPSVHKKLQSQFLAALAVETLIPVFLMHVPAGVAYIACFLDCSNNIIGSILTMTISLYPAIDPLPTIVIISPYRNALLKIIGDLLKPVSCVQKFVAAITETIDEEGMEDDIL